MICTSSELADAGRAVRFDLQGSEGPVPCFAIRFQGRAHAYVNHCPHRGTELDWNPGEVFGESGLYLTCATHGAMFNPETGLCLAGPCVGQRLQALPLEEQDGVIIINAALNY